MQISKHLTLAEACKSQTADKLGINNENINEETINNLKLLAEKVFEPIREHFKTPINLSSVYRCKQLNLAVKGSTTSQHCTGEAMDIDSVKPTNKEIFEYIKTNLKFDQMIWEFGTKDNPDWVHVSYESSRPQRNEILKASKVNGKTIYIPWK